MLQFRLSEGCSSAAAGTTLPILLPAANVGRYEKNDGEPKATFLPTTLMFFTLLLVPRGLVFTLAFFFSDFSGELPSRWANVTPPPPPSHNHTPC